MMSALLFLIGFLLVLLLVYLGRYSGRVNAGAQRLIAVSPEMVFNAVADFRRWSEWEPWSEHDRGLPASVLGAPDGRGGVYDWFSPRAGQVTVTHQRLLPNREIRQRLCAASPFRYAGKLVWTLAETTAGQTEVQCRFRGRVGFVFRAFSPTVREMVRLDLAYALDRLAASLGAPDAAPYRLAYEGVVEVPPQTYVYAGFQGPFTGIVPAAGAAYSRLTQALGEHGLQPVDAPLAVYLKTNVKLRTTTVRFGLPVAGGSALPAGVDSAQQPACRAYRVRLTGPCTALEIAWYQAMRRLVLEGFQPDQTVYPFERYVTRPADCPAAEWVTELYLPVREKTV